MLIGKIVSLRAVEKKDLKQLLIWRNNPKFRIFLEKIVKLITITRSNGLKI